MLDASITPAERNALLLVIKNRDKIFKAALAQRAADMLAEFEHQISTTYYPDDHAAWAAAYKAVREATTDANDKIAAVCKELGIPRGLAPQVHHSWYERGENKMKERRDELRKVAQAEIKAMVKKAEAGNVRASVGAQERIVVASLTGEAARALLDGLPTVEQLLPGVEWKAVPRIAERLRHDQANVEPDDDEEA
jgi:hypothetical protein